jgi:hypothetical protein
VVPEKLGNQAGFYLTGQVVVAYSQGRLTSQDFGRPRERDFAKLNLHLRIFEQPDKNGFFSNLLMHYGLGVMDWGYLRVEIRKKKRL